MWTENVTWFSNEEGKKGRIEVGQFADMIVPDRDFFSCAESEIAGMTSDLTVVGAASFTVRATLRRSMARRPHRRCRIGRRCAASAGTAIEAASSALAAGGAATKQSTAATLARWARRKSFREKIAIQLPMGRVRMNFGNVSAGELYHSRRSPRRRIRLDKRRHAGGLGLRQRPL
jgi:hypothetical protein